MNPASQSIEAAALHSGGSFCGDSAKAEPGENVFPDDFETEPLTIEEMDEMSEYYERWME